MNFHNSYTNLRQKVHTATHVKSIKTPASVPEWKAATLGGSARQVRRLAGACDQVGSPRARKTRVRLERRETVSFHLPSQLQNNKKQLPDSTQASCFFMLNQHYGGLAAHLPDPQLHRSFSQTAPVILHPMKFHSAQALSIQRR